MIEGIPTRSYDPIQGVLAHLPDGTYGTYEGLMNHLLLSPLVPMEIKEGLRYLSAVTIGCEFCRTFREVDESGTRLLPEEFYVRVAAGDPSWEELVPVRWAPAFAMAGEVHALERALRDHAVSAENLTGHRLSHALGIPAACAVPAASAVSPS